MPDLLMWVGEEHYRWPHEFFDEAERVGVSKRVPREAVPYIVPGETRLALIHPRAIVEATAKPYEVYDLAVELALEYAPLPEQGEYDDWAIDYANEHLMDSEWHHTMELIRLLADAEFAGGLDWLEEKYGIEYHPGVFMFTYLTGVQYVLRSGESKLPADLRGTGAEAVRVEYGD